MSDDNFTMDQGDEQTPLLIRIPNSGDAAAVERKVGASLASLTIAEQASLTIPSAAEASRANLVGDVQESNVGTPQDQIELSRLSANLEVVKAEVVKVRAQGSTVDNKLMNRMIAAENSLNFQADRMRANTPDPVAVEADSDQDTLLSAYDSEKTRAVNAMARDKNTSLEHAERLVDQVIAVKGEAAVLPIYSRIKARMDRKYPSAA